MPDDFVTVEGEALIDWDLSGNLLVLVIERLATAGLSDKDVDFVFDEATYSCPVQDMIVLPLFRCAS